jgi:hypothetical protein
LLLSLAACKKDDVTPQSYPDKIVLANSSMTGDSLALSWTKLDNPDLVEYRVMRRLSPNSPGVMLHTWQYQYTGSNKLTATRFTDKEAPYTGYVDYQIVGTLPNGQSIKSNSLVINRMDIKTIDVSPFDVQFDRTRRQLYFFEKTGTISQYNLSTSTLGKSVNTDATIGHSDFATFNGVPELYVPRNDGWVFVYNAQTLEKIDQLNVGSAATCVAAHNGLLYVSTASWLNRPLKVYNRASKTLVAETGDWNSTRFKRVPGSNLELLEMTINIGPPDQHYYSFTPSGNLLGHFADRYHGDHQVDGNIFEIFPAGTKYITSSEGTIYSKALVYEATLPHGNLAFTSFCFDAAGQTVYAGTTTRTIEGYSLANYAHTRTITTKAYPYRLFEDGSNGFVCLSSSTRFSAYGAPSQLIIEQLR